MTAVGRVVRLQILEQVGKKLSLCFALGAHAWAIPSDEFDVDERARVIDNHEHLARV